MTPAERAAAIAAQGRARQAANRAAAPVIAAWWDGWSAVFTFAAIDLTDPTTGRRWRRGDMTPDTGRSMNADQWLHYVSTGEKPWISIEGPR